MNVFENGIWGSYRHVNISDDVNEKPRNDCCIVDSTRKGDLSALHWVKKEGAEEIEDKILVSYASINFKDVMLALGKIWNHNKTIVEKSLIGLEFSGIRVKDKKRVMGIMFENEAMATIVDNENSILWEIPDDWPMEAAATIPVVYFTVYYSFFIVSNIEKGKLILIHSGAGGVGQAAIRVALAYGLEVFTTVGNESKKNFLLKTFSELKPEKYWKFS